NGSSSTALPTFPANDALSFSSSPSEMQSVAHLLKPQLYESRPVFPGQLILFRQSTPHYGVRSSGENGQRLVLFSVLSPSSKPAQDALQVYPWPYIGAAFGWNSREFARALVENKAHKPLDRCAVPSHLEHAERSL